MSIPVNEQMLTVDQALEHILKLTPPPQGKEKTTLHKAHQRILASDVIATFNVPPFRSSAMDGYAIRWADLQTTGSTKLAVAGQSFAGHPYDAAIATGEAIRIMTGAVVPENADTVVMQEHVTIQDKQLEIPAGQIAGQNVREAGEDLKTGAVILHSGRKLNAADIGLLASMGIVEVEVTRKPKVAIFSTGDELQSLGTPLTHGQIYDSNRYTLSALLLTSGVEIIDMGVLVDDEALISQALHDAAASADIIITSGGVSVGEADYIKDILMQLGQVDFWKIAMKPGKPLAFGKLGDTLFFGLPGNPVSAMVTFSLFVRESIRILSGADPQPSISLTAISQSDLKKQSGRREYQRGVYTRSNTGALQVSTTGAQGSHILKSMSLANCFVVLPRQSEDIPAGSELEIIPFSNIL
jgi:molybdopterin molybdotransferase